MTNDSGFRPSKAQDMLVLDALIYEFPFSKKEATEKLIRGRLKRKKLGPFDLQRVALLRRLKDELQQQVNVYGKSKYYRRRAGKYAEYQDYDIPRLTVDTQRLFPEVSKEVIEWFVPFCVLTYYMR